MSNQNTRQYLRSIILNSLAGKKISKEENKKLEQSILNFSAGDWRTFKRVSKEAILEFLEQQINKQSDFPEQWKVPVKENIIALINFVFSLFSEEFILEVVACQKQKVSQKQMALRCLPLLTKQMRLMANRKRSSVTPSNKGWKGIKKKWETLQGLTMLNFRKSDKDAKIKRVQNIADLRKILSLLKKTSPAEIKVLKDKGKEYVWWFLNKYASYELSHPELKDFVIAGIDLLDALIDENITAEGIKLFCEGMEIFCDWAGQIDFTKLGENSEYTFSVIMRLIQEARQKGLESRFLSSLSETVNHFNRLAGEEISQPVSSSEEQDLSQKIAEARVEHNNDNSQNGTEYALGFANPVNLINNLASDNSSSNPRPNRPIDYLEAANKWNELMTEDTLGLEKWYHKWWGIGLMVVGGAIISGVVIWLFLRSKSKDKKIEPWEKKGYY